MSNWFQQIVNKDEVPNGQIYVAIQFGKAKRYLDATHFAEIHRVLSFSSLERAQHFIDYWDSKTMNDYREAMPKEDFSFFVYDRCPNGYYADEIRMRADWEPIII